MQFENILTPLNQIQLVGNLSVTINILIKN